MYEDYTHTHTRMYKVKLNVKKGILKFSNFISYVISFITGENLPFSYEWKYGFHY